MSPLSHQHIITANEARPPHPSDSPRVPPGLGLEDGDTSVPPGYDPHRLQGIVVKGDLMRQSTPELAMAWPEIMGVLQADGATLGPNVVRFLLPAGEPLRAKERKAVWLQLTAAFIAAFPGKEPASVRLPEEHGSLRRFVDITTDASNVTADDIIRAAKENLWKVAGRPLGPAAFVGPRIPEGIQVIQLKLSSELEPATPLTNATIKRAKNAAAWAT
ncbi:hypothetical protein BCV70DRAFT_219804 [Testicularia cyperi]|uniref:Uncharacterized protein n=1 Tax=Testicularia cyperi TaxID=1882483 RepID=A0A317XF26_9BASI|nr:hypothetical protein BCV70DRAFT_219804 [Testicularia cyperi]